MVVDLDPELKRRLHARLRKEGRDFKGWLLERVEEYLGPSQGDQPSRGDQPSQGDQPLSELSELERRVLESMSPDVRAKHHVDDLMQATGLGVREIREALLRLELAGRVVQHLGLYGRARPS